MRAISHRYGQDFESRVEYQAKVAGLLLVRHGTQVRYLPGGKTLAIKSDLDFRMSNRQGRTIFFDCKSFQESSFSFSKLTHHQKLRAALYHSYSLQAGFLVELRGADSVLYYDIAAVMEAGPRSRFDATNGLNIGPSNWFELERLLPSAAQRF